MHVDSRQKRAIGAYLLQCDLDDKDPEDWDDADTLRKEGLSLEGLVVPDVDGLTSDEEAREGEEEVEMEEEVVVVVTGHLRIPSPIQTSSEEEDEEELAEEEGGGRRWRRFRGVLGPVKDTCHSVISKIYSHACLPWFMCVPPAPPSLTRGDISPFSSFFQKKYFHGGYSTVACLGIGQLDSEVHACLKIDN